MLDKLKNLSTAAKVGIAGGAVLLAAGGVGLGITQPWNQSAQEVDNAPPPCSSSSRKILNSQRNHPLA